MDTDTLISSPSFQTYSTDITAGIKANNSSRYSTYLKNLKLQKMSNEADALTERHDLDTINEYLKYAKTDYIQGMAKNDANLSDALQQATENYGANNLLGSGIQLAGSTEKVADNNLDNQWLKNTEDQQLAQYGIQKQRAIDKYTQYTNPVNQMQLDNIKYKPTAIPNQATIEENYLSSYHWK